MKYRDFFKEDLLPGGKGDNKSPESVDPQQLAMGIKVEMEHTSDPNMAKEIAIDHLTEDPQYYSKLKSAGMADELQSSADAVSEPDTNKADTQTDPKTTYQQVEKGSDCGCGDTNISTKQDGATDVDKSPSDPSGTDHVTGTIGSTPSNPNIISKKPAAVTSPDAGNVGKDITIDIVESKKILEKMKKDTAKEGYGGDPSTDPKYVKNKRWTVKY